MPVQKARPPARATRTAPKRNELRTRSESRRGWTAPGKTRTPRRERPRRSFTTGRRPMGTTTSNIAHRPADDATREELRAIRLELIALRRLFDHFAGVFLNSRFPYGKATDRW